MKQEQLNLKVPKVKIKMVKYVMDITPAQSKQLKTLAFNKDITIKKMILDIFGIE